MIPSSKIYLASKSPRRRELLRQVGIEFETILLRDAPPRGPDVTEFVLPNEKAHDYVARVTQEKAQAAWKAMIMRKLPAHPILAADTSVILDDTILGKPVDVDHAIAMLSSLAGRSHTVLTSIALQTAHELLHCTQESEVHFCSMSKNEIRAYCQTHEPYDKAGGYGIQGLAARYISHINGSYSGIMGLPLFETCKLLQQAGLQHPT
jgi:septum formation protein